jgi:NAD(P)H-hydrate epimerase
VPPSRLPPRPADGHKGSFGRVLVVAGRRGMSGAAVLCGSAALRGGAGLVQVACPADIQDVVALGNPCYLTADIRESVALAKSADALAIGPGLGDTGDFVRELLTAVPGVPAVVDADGLRAFHPGPVPRAGPTVLTPHPGEFGRLTGLGTAAVQADRERLSREWAKRLDVVLLLKGHRTVVTDGDRLTVNATGNPGMATGGTGDVLTGLLAAFLAQRLGAFPAAELAAWVHGHAGDLAADDLGQTALTAADVLGYLPAAVRAAEG